MKPIPIAAEPAYYFDTEHFREWPAILVRMAAIGDDTLRDRIEAAWRLRAPKTIVKRYDAAPRSGM